MTTLKRCWCGRYARHGSWIKPDKVQLDCIAIALQKKEIKIESQMCDECKDAYAGFRIEKASQR